MDSYTDSDEYLVAYLNEDCYTRDREIIPVTERSRRRWAPAVSSGVIPPDWSKYLVTQCGGKADVAWTGYWPMAMEPLVWDVVGRVQMSTGGWEWLLVKTFVCTSDVATGACAVDVQSEQIVREVLDDAKLVVSAPLIADWTNQGYEYTSRMAVLRFLRRHDVCVRLLFIFFYSDGHSGNAVLPTIDQWRDTIDVMEDHLGLTGSSILERRVYKVFLPAVC